jgi:hypothetical protein
MNKITLNKSYECDILIRVYESQNPNVPESDQIVGEVLFKDKPHIRASAWLPKGIAEFINSELLKIEDKNYNIHISNELPYQVGVLTSCKENFDLYMNKLLNK